MIYTISKDNWQFSNCLPTTVENCIEYLESIDMISLDTETQGFDIYTKKLLTLQLGDKNIQYIIDCNTIDILQFKDILEKKTIIAHNMKFDFKFLYHKGIDIKNFYDTFLIEAILRTGLDNQPGELSLKGVAFKYLNIDLDKTIRGQIHAGISESVIQYAADDITYLEDILKLQLNLIKKWSLENTVKLEMLVCRCFAIQEYNGIKINQEKIKEVVNEISLINIELENKLDNLIVSLAKEDKRFKRFTRVQLNLFTEEIKKTTINWSSPAQKVEIISLLGYNTKSVNEQYLSSYKNSHPIFELLLEKSKISKLENSFGLKLLSFINPVTNRIHPEIRQILSTGRISVSNPGMQQIPAHSELGKKIKSCFVAKEGNKIVSADYSAIELKIVAEFSQDPLWIDTFNNGGDLHSILCAETFNIPIENVKDPFPNKPDITYRFLQKSLNFGLIYGLGVDGFANTSKLPKKKAKEIIEKFFKKVPDVKNLLSLLANSGVSHKYIRINNTFGRIRFFDKHNETEEYLASIKRASMNAPIQGTNADILKLAIIKLQDKIDTQNLPVKLILNVHDEIISECREDFAEEWSNILEETMIKAAQVIIKSVPVKVDKVISNYWTD